MKRKISIEIDGLTVRLGNITALENISAVIGSGTITAVIGPNGAGKTTLLQAIMGTVPYEGSISFRYDNGDEVIPRLSYVPQRMEFDRGIPMTVYDFISMSHCRHPLWIPHRKTNRPLIESRLKTVSAEHLLFRQFGKLSGGEVQRVILALALMNDPEILLMDEPEAGIDVIGEQLFQELLRRINEKGDMTLLMVSHDLAMVNTCCDHVLCINKTIRCQGPSPDVMTGENLKEVFGGELGIYVHRHSPEGS